MPNRDGNGPFGNGRPGRGLGPCGRGGRFMGFGGNGYRRRGRCWGLAQSSQTQPEAGIYPFNDEGLEARKAEVEAELKWINEQMENKDGR